MILPDLTPDDTWPESALAAHQVMSDHIEQMSTQFKEFTNAVDQLQRQLKLMVKRAAQRIKHIFFNALRPTAR